MVPGGRPRVLQVRQRWLKAWPTEVQPTSNVLQAVNDNVEETQDGEENSQCQKAQCQEKDAVQAKWVSAGKGTQNQVFKVVGEAR